MINIYFEGINFIIVIIRFSIADGRLGIHFESKKMCCLSSHHRTPRIFQV